MTESVGASKTVCRTIGHGALIWFAYGVIELWLALVVPVMIGTDTIVPWYTWRLAALALVAYAFVGGPLTGVMALLLSIWVRFDRSEKRASLALLTLTVAFTMNILTPPVAHRVDVLGAAAGRVADTGRDPLPLMVEALAIMQRVPQSELIWASPRELLNVFEVDRIGCHVITMTNDILKKLSLVDRSLTDYSLDTVKMFHTDAKAAGFSL